MAVLCGSRWRNAASDSTTLRNGIASWCPPNGSDLPVLMACPRQQFGPSLHPAFHVADLLGCEELLQLHLSDGILWPHEILFVPIGDSGIDAHPAFIACVRRRPLFIARSHSFGRHECLATPAGCRIEYVCTRIDARGDGPHDIIHAVDVRVFADRDHDPHAL